MISASSSLGFAALFSDVWPSRSALGSLRQLQPQSQSMTLPFLLQPRFRRITTQEGAANA